MPPCVSVGRRCIPFRRVTRDTQSPVTAGRAPRWSSSCPDVYNFVEPRAQRARRACFVDGHQVRDLFQRRRGSAHELDRMANLFDPVPLVFFFCVFFLVEAVDGVGILDVVSTWIASLYLNSRYFELLLMMSVVSVISAAFSAGPGNVCQTEGHDRAGLRPDQTGARFSAVPSARDGPDAW